MQCEDFDVEILNRSLSLAMEWGENLLKPIQDRIMFAYSVLTIEEANFLNKISQKIKTDTNDFIFKRYSDEHIKELQKLYYIYLSENYSWINQINLNRLFNQGCYYAFK